MNRRIEELELNIELDNSTFDFKLFQFVETVVDLELIHQFLPNIAQILQSDDKRLQKIEELEMDKNEKNEFFENLNLLVVETNRKKMNSCVKPFQKKSLVY